MFVVRVEATWKSGHTFEFDTEEEANEFRRAINAGDLNALVREGDVHSGTAELTDFEAGYAKQRSA